jgi:hypothetical protein
MKLKKIEFPVQISKSQSQTIPTLRSFLYSHISNNFSSNLFIPIPQGSKVKCYIGRKKTFFNKDTLSLYQSSNNNCLLNGFKTHGKTGTVDFIGTEQNKRMYGTMEAKRININFGLF